MRLVSRLRRRLRDENGDRQRGAALVEFVLIAPVLVLITAAIFEYGLAFRDSMTLSNALRSGARVGSNAGREREADYTILKSVEAAMTEVPELTHRPAHRLQGDDGRLGRARLLPGDPGQWWRQRPLQRLPGVRSGCPLSDYGGTTSCSAGAPDRYWCPTARQNSQALGADYLGVWMEIRYTYVTKVLPGTGITIRDRAVMRLEPRLT